MFSRSDSPRPAMARQGPRRGLRPLDVAVLAGTIGVLMLLPPQGVAEAGVNATDDRNVLDLPPVATASVEPAGKGPYRMRCWQYGRLLLDEYLAALPAESNARGRITATDAHGRPLRVTDLQSVACLIRSSAGDDVRSSPR